MTNLTESISGHPLLTIWLKPRQTIRSIVDNRPSYLVLILAVIFGINSVIDFAMDRSLGDLFPMLYLLVIFVIAGPLTGLAVVYLGGLILSWIGRLLGGAATPQETRAAVAWSSLPQCIGLGLNGIYMMVFGLEAFTFETPRTDAMFASNPNLLSFMGAFLLVLVVLMAVATIWSLVLLVICLAEVHHYSIKRSVVTVFIPGFVLFLLLGACTLALTPPA